MEQFAEVLESRPRAHVVIESATLPRPGRLRAEVGPLLAVVRQIYHDPGAAVYDAQHRQRVIHHLRQRAGDLGLGLVDRATGDLLAGAVS